METGKIFTSLADINRELEAIGKEQINETQKFKFRGIDDVYNALNPLLKRYSVFCTPEVIDNKRETTSTIKTKKDKYGEEITYTQTAVSVVLTVKYSFFTVDGSSVSVTVCGEGLDYGDKATPKAMAIAHKYALLQLFCIPTQDGDDPDKDAFTRGSLNKPAAAKKNAPTPKPNPAPASDENTPANPKNITLYLKRLEEYGVFKSDAEKYIGKPIEKFTKADEKKLVEWGIQLKKEEENIKELEKTVDAM